MINTMNKKAASSATLLVLCSMMTGCMNLAPNYERPAAPIASVYSLPDYYKQVLNIDDESLGLKSDQKPLQTFSDERLQKLITIALENNRDLRTAALNVTKARAQYGIQDAQTLPTIDAAGGVSASRVPADFSATRQERINREHSVSLGTTAYELDFFGRVQNLKAQALEEMYGTEEAKQTVQLSLITEVANSWVTWAEDQDLLAVAESLLDSQTETLSLIHKRYDLGDATALELRQQEIAVATARSEAERLIGQNAQDRNALTLLLGTQVPEALIPTGFGQAVMTNDGTDVITAIPVGLPSDLMLRRPDILESEHRLKAANANIGVARAAFYPSISLTATGGLRSVSLNDLFDSTAKAWSFAPQISLPIFDGGANQANLDIAQADRDIAVANYEKTIQTAFREVSDALALRASITNRLDAQRALIVASEQAFSLTKARYEHGVDSWLDVLDAERVYTDAHTGLITLYGEQQTNSLTLFKVLGGGWDDKTAEL